MFKKNFRLMFTFYFVMFGIAIALFGSLIEYKLQMANIQKQIDKNAEEVAFNKKTNTLEPTIERMNSMVVALATNTTLQEYLEEPNYQHKNDMTNLFYAIAMSDRLIMQARFIDANGKEKIRIDRLNESSIPFVVEDTKLQDKSTRDYFQSVRNMPNGKIWHSKLDLNIEHGKIEVPFRPTIRIATPIYTKDKFVGMVIINMLTNKLLDGLRTSPEFEHYIIDKEGNFIIHPNNILSWSKYAKTSAKLIDEFPTEASDILSGIRKGDDFYAYSLNDVLDNDDEAILILKPKADYKHSLILSNMQSAAVVVILSILLSIPLALYASITPSKLQKALWTSNKELKRFTDILDKYVISVSTKTNSIITTVSSAFERVSGYTKEELYGKKINIIRHPDTLREVHEELWNTIENGNEWHGEFKNRDKDGQDYWLEESIIPIKNEKEEIVSYISVGIDITAKKELERISMIDKLTGVFNRRQLDQCIHHEVEKASRYHRPLSLLMIDIDHFKKVNDTYGHQIGDYALVTVSQILAKHIRSSDVLGRFGGEEFVLLCPESDKNEAAVLGEKLRKEIELFAFDTIGNLTVSIGVAELKEDMIGGELLYKADVALYKAKNSGRNQVVAEG